MSYREFALDLLELVDRAENYDAGLAINKRLNTLVEFQKDKIEDLTYELGQAKMEIHDLKAELSYYRAENPAPDAPPPEGQPDA